VGPVAWLVFSDEHVDVAFVVHPTYQVRLRKPSVAKLASARHAGGRPSVVSDPPFPFCLLARGIRVKFRPA
jgi:hypothetical protein